MMKVTKNSSLDEPARNIQDLCLSTRRLAAVAPTPSSHFRLCSTYVRWERQHGSQPRSVRPSVPRRQSTRAQSRPRYAPISRERQSGRQPSGAKRQIPLGLPRETRRPRCASPRCLHGSAGLSPWGNCARWCRPPRPSPRLRLLLGPHPRVLPLGVGRSTCGTERLALSH